jgi:flagellar motor switch protein FliN
MSESMVGNKPAGGAAHPKLGSFEAGSAAAPIGGDPAISLDSVMRIPVSVQVVLGATTMPVANLMKLSHGAIVPLDSRVGEPVDVVVNGRVVARGELVVMDDDNTRFGISLTEVVGSGEQNGAAA